MCCCNQKPKLQVMALGASWKENVNKSQNSLKDALSGNLMAKMLWCRTEGK